MRDAVVVGLLDSGVDPAQMPAAWPRRSFMLDDEGAVVPLEDGAPDLVGHGTDLARIILDGRPDIGLAVARIFIDRFACTPAAAAAGLDWLVERRARIVNMSFGLSQDRVVLRESVERALAAGALLIAAAPARGHGVFPSSYGGVVRVSGDARCSPGEISVLGGKQADFGACVGAPREDGSYGGTGGASFATGHFSGQAAAFLCANPDADNEQILEAMAGKASYHGPERRSAGG